MRAAAVQIAGSPGRGSVESRYEALRMAGLGEPVSPECRRGLVLFLRRGMWGWARAPAAVTAPEPVPRPGFPEPTAPDQHRTAVQILAAMAMGLTHRMTQ